MRTVLSLNDSWRFWLEPQGFTPAELADGAENISVPHCWNRIDGQSGNGYARRCQVLCGGTTEDGRTAIHYGLTPGQKVITTNLASLSEGTPVQPE